MGYKHQFITLASIHDLNLAAAFCDRLYVIDHGKIIASGTPREVLAQGAGHRNAAPVIAHQN